MKIAAFMGGAAALMATPAFAGTPFEIYGYDLPVSLAFGSVTTDGYSYYTGPFVLTTSIGPMTVFCVDLNHYTETGPLYTFELGTLAQTGTGAPISPAISNEIGAIAVIGKDALRANNDALAVAAQAAIWDVEYGVTSSTGNTEIAADIAWLLGRDYPEPSPLATALIPYGIGWPGNADAPQQLVAGIPEPSTWAMMALGFAGLGCAGYCRRRGVLTRRA